MSARSFLYTEHTQVGSARPGVDLKPGKAVVGVGFRIEGMDAVKAALRGLDEKQTRRMLQKASTRAAKVLKPLAVAAAPVQAPARPPKGWKGVSWKGGSGYTQPGTLRRSISATQADKDRPAAIVRVRVKDVPASRRAFYRHMVIGGTRAHHIRGHREVVAGVWRKDGSIPHPGTRPNPFMARALAAGRPAAEAAIQDTVKQWLAGAARTKR